MKSLAFYFSAVLAGATLLFSCDTIDNPFPKAFDQLTAAEGHELDSVEVKNGFKPAVQKVLLEDYTGHTCGNCPGASVVAKNEKAKYGDKLVVMAVHAGYFAKAEKAPYLYNFSTPEGEELATSFGVISNPNGMINRVPKTGTSSAVQSVANWPGVIATQMAQTPKIGMTMTTVYKSDTRKVNVKVRSEYLASLPGKFNIAVFITEDSIVKWQKNYGAAAGGDPAYATGDVEKYVHPHALRAALTGTWGRLNKENPKQNEIVEAYFTTTLNPEWKEEHCSVVAFIYEEATKQVVQVEEVHIH